MMEKQKESISPKVETYTYYQDTNRNPVEVLLIGVDPQHLGSENDFEPPGFNKHHITTWLRKRYFFLNGTLFAQVPKRTVDFPSEAKDQLDLEDSFATDVTFNAEEKILNVFYPLNEGRTVQLTWDLDNESWSMGVQEIPVSNGNIDPAVLDESERIWSAP